MKEDLEPEQPGMPPGGCGEHDPVRPLKRVGPRPVGIHGDVHPDGPGRPATPEFRGQPRRKGRLVAGQQPLEFRDPGRVDGPVLRLPVGLVEGHHRSERGVGGLRPGSGRERLRALRHFW